MNKEPELALDPELLERFKTQGILKASFAYFEQHDEWNLEDIRVDFADGRVIEECYGDALSRDLRGLLECVTDTRTCELLAPTAAPVLTPTTHLSGGIAVGLDAQDGYFELDVSRGTVVKLSEAFITELRWWQLPEPVRQALIDAHVLL
jgi:hypothetical protein